MRLIALIAALWVALAATPSWATTAIFHSAAENTYGWCAGFAEARSERCARGYCEDAGGTDCQLAIECPGGWGAVALGPPGRGGFAGVCGLDTIVSARILALTACAAQTNALCHLTATFDGRGNKQSAQTNQTFEQTWMTQLLLQLNSIPLDIADGKPGARTRDALRTFQTRIGLDTTGATDESLIRILMDAAGGEQYVARKMKSSILDRQDDKVSDLFYATASQPVNLTFAEDLLARSEQDRLAALAVVLLAEEIACPIPAVSATLVSDPKDDASTWLVSCTERSYLLSLSSGSTMIVGQ